MPKSIPVSVRLSSETFRVAKDLARRTSRPLSAVVSELAEEALRGRRHPGIAFGGPPGSRRARVEGTGVDVWEVIAIYRACGSDVERTGRALSHLTTRQVDAALRYAREYAREIDALVEENARPRSEWEQLYPHLAPESR